MRRLPSVRPWNDESGFTLTEVLVTILLMTLVVFALYSMFDMSLRVFRFGNSTVESNQNARVAVDRMEREIRSAWNVSATNCSPATATGSVVVSSSNLNSITFKNCTSGGAGATPVEISYSVNSGVLQRTTGGTTQPLADLGTPSSGASPLAFRYLNVSGNPVTSPYDGAVLVEITLIANEGGREQRLVTNAGLRNARYGS